MILHLTRKRLLVDKKQQQQQLHRQTSFFFTSTQSSKRFSAPQRRRKTHSDWVASAFLKTFFLISWLDEFQCVCEFCFSMVAVTLKFLLPAIFANVQVSCFASSRDGKKFSIRQLRHEKFFSNFLLIFPLNWIRNRNHRSIYNYIHCSRNPAEYLLMQFSALHKEHEKMMHKHTIFCVWKTFFSPPSSHRKQCNRKFFIRQIYFFNNDRFPWQHVPRLPSEIFNVFVRRVYLKEKRETTNGGAEKYHAIYI